MGFTRVRNYSLHLCRTQYGLVVLLEIPPTIDLYLLMHLATTAQWSSSLILNECASVCPL
jgi:hypothetical protein